MKYIYTILLVLLLPCAHAGAASVAKADHAQASVPALDYRSDFADYQAFRDESLMIWSEEEHLRSQPAMDAPEAGAAPPAHGQHESRGQHE